MPRNIEIKARVASLALLEPRVAAIATEGPTPIAQDDTFFNCPNGRLKLRQFSAEAGELIFYQRADAGGPKTSFYVRTPTQDPAGLREALTLAHGVVGRVVKARTLYLVGRTRVHLDRVQDLGEFMELEVVLADDEAESAGAAEADALMRALGIAQADCIAGAYLDLLAAGQQDAKSPNTTMAKGSANHVPLRLQPGDDLRGQLTELAREQACGFVVAGIGSLQDARLRLADAAEATRIAGPVEILSLSGSLAENGVHLHMSIADASGRVTGGHVLAGNIVRTTAEVLLAPTSEYSLRREPDVATGFEELVVQQRKS
jgi:predicted adenylyl cyclase CyaB